MANCLPSGNTDPPRQLISCSATTARRCHRRECPRRVETGATVNAARTAGFRVRSLPICNPGDFLLRFTPTEQGAIQQLAITNGQIALGLTMGLARGYIDLAGRLLGPWMDALTAAGAIASGRKAVILTP
jgi:hypothetical protein